MKKILIPIIAGSVLASQAFADKPEWVEKKNAEKHEMKELKKAEKHEMKEYKKSEKHHDDESRRHKKEHHGYDQDRSKGNEENEASNEDNGKIREFYKKINFNHFPIDTIETTMYLAEASYIEFTKYFRYTQIQFCDFLRFFLAGIRILTGS